jgi:hypothetical protein
MDAESEAFVRLLLQAVGGVLVLGIIAAALDYVNNLNDRTLSSKDNPPPFVVGCAAIAAVIVSILVWNV